LSNLRIMKKNFIKLLLGPAIFISGFLALNSDQQAFAVNPDITIPLGQTAPFQVPEGISTVVLGDDSIASVVVPPGQNKLMLIKTVKAGLTNILVFSERGGPPNNFILEVQDTSRADQVVTRVKVFEVFSGDDGKFGVDWQDFITFTEAPVSAPFKFGLPVRNTSLSAKIDTLINDRKGRLLAAPTLVSLDGKDAKFLSGGEYPVLVYERDRVNITWKEYGIKLDLNAKVEGNENILITLKPEVSSIDRANSVLINGGGSTGSAVIPAFNSRKAETTLTVRNNESIVIAGLINNTQETVDSKIPILGDIPVLGFLFKTREFRNVRTELVFIVTPSILKNSQVNPERGYADEAEKLEKKP
jgi:Flp pilus assembly secretin CpaC